MELKELKNSYITKEHSLTKLTPQKSLLSHKRTRKFKQIKARGSAVFLQYNKLAPKINHS